MTPDDSRRQTNLQSLKNITMAVYALQAASFLLGITYFVAIIINYVKRDDARGTWLESHFRWQIRTFWFTLLWFAVGGATFILIYWLFHFICQWALVYLSHHQGLVESERWQADVCLR